MIAIQINRPYIRNENQPIIAVIFGQSEAGVTPGIPLLYLVDILSAKTHELDSQSHIKEH